MPAAGFDTKNVMVRKSLRRQSAYFLYIVLIVGSKMKEGSYN